MPYNTRQEALAISFSLGGGIGAHKIDGGEWNPCKTEDIYKSANTLGLEVFKPPIDINKELQELGYDSVSGFILEDLTNMEAQIITKNSSFATKRWISNMIQELGDGYDPVDDKAFSKSSESSLVCKVDNDRRLVFGWAQICTKGGEDYYDSDNQCFPENPTLGDANSGWTKFMMQSRIHKAMHSGDEVGDVVFAFPAFGDIMKSLGFGAIEKTGIITGVYVKDDDVLEKFHKGEYTGFSIGGSANFEDED